MKMDRQDRKTIRYRRLLIYTFLLVMVFMYISTKISMQKEKEALLEVRETSEVETEMNQGANTQIGTEPKETAGSRTKDSGKNAGMDTGTDTGTVTETDTTGFQIEEEDLWSLVLTNDKYPVPDGYEFREVSIPDTDQTIDNRVLEPLMKMLDGAKKEGMNQVF